MLERYVTDEFNAADKDFSSGLLLFLQLIYSEDSVAYCSEDLYCLQMKGLFVMAVFSYFFKI